jgi:hypothetical protein
LGNFQNEPIMPQETHVGYVEGYLDVLKKVQDVHERHPSMSVRDICFVLKTSMRTTITAGGGISIPNDLRSFPSVVHLLQETGG